MKKIFLLLLVASHAVAAPPTRLRDTVVNGSIGVGSTAVANSKSMLDVVSTTKGSLPLPRMTETQRDAITSPPTGLMVYNTDTNQVDVFNGTLWAALAAAEAPQTASDNLLNLGLSATVAANALTIALKQADGTTDAAAASAAVNIGFRSSTLASGAYTQRTVTGALSLVVSSGSTLGTTNGIAYDLFVYALDNAGTVELAISRSVFKEGLLYSTTAEGGAGAADNASVLYSTTSRSNVPIRLIGRVTSTQATAGTWATTPSAVAVRPFHIGVITNTGLEKVSMNASITNGCSLTSELEPWVSSVTNNSSSNCTVNITSGVFSATPYCTCTGYRSGGGRVICSIDTTTTPSATAIRIFLYDENGSATGNGAFLSCSGYR